MAGPSELKRLWRRYRAYRATKKDKSRQASSESSSRDSEDSMVSDESGAMLVDSELDSKEEEEEYEEYHEYFIDDDDPRLINNPHGIGCSRTYEGPYESVMDYLLPSRASMRPLVPQEAEPNEGGGLHSFPNLGPWRPEDIDRVKGKRKGRMPGDSADDRYKFLLDGPASRPRFSAKRFSLVRVRQRAWTG